MKKLLFPLVVCALAAHNGWNVHQLDIKIAFLNGDST